MSARDLAIGLLLGGGETKSYFQHILDNQHDVIWNVVNTHFKVSLGVFYNNSNIGFYNSGVVPYCDYNIATSEARLDFRFNKVLYSVATVWKDDEPIYCSLVQRWGGQDGINTFTYYDHRKYTYYAYIEEPKMETVHFDQRTFNVFVELNASQGRISTTMYSTPDLTWTKNYKHYSYTPLTPDEFPTIYLDSESEYTDSRSGDARNYLYPRSDGSSISDKTRNELIQIQSDFTKAVYDANNIAYYDGLVLPS